MQSKNFLLDASIIIKWYNQDDESNADKALKILKDYRDQKIKIFLSDLTIFEVGNVVSAKSDSCKSKKFLSELRNLKFVHFDELSLNRTVDLVKKYNVTFYDASYHALALLNDLVFITADLKYFNKVQLVRNIMMLGEY